MEGVILHIVISLATGGLEKFVLDLVRANQTKFEHVIVCLEQLGELADTSVADSISLNMQPGLRLSVAFELAKIAHEKKTAVIHTHNEKAQFYGALAGFLARVPVVHTKHGKNSTDWRSVVRNNLAARFCKKVVAVSHDAAVQCVEDEKIPAGKVMTILNGVDLSRFSRVIDHAKARCQLGIDPNIPVVGIVARLALIKDHANLLTACRLVKDANHSFNLLIVGDGPLRSEMEQLTALLGLEGCVIFTGSRSDIPELMQAMDVFVLSSRSEGVSLTLIEAMACELPIVATAVGGNPEVVKEGVTGFLVPSQNPEALAEKIIQLLVDPVLRLQFGKAGHRRAETEFSLSRAADQYVSLYHSILHENNS